MHNAECIMHNESAKLKELAVSLGNGNTLRTKSSSFFILFEQILGNKEAMEGAYFVRDRHC